MKKIVNLTNLEHLLYSSVMSYGYALGLSFSVVMAHWMNGRVNDLRTDIHTSTRLSLLHQMVDTSDRDAALRALHQEREARQAAEMESAQSRLHVQLAKEEVRRLQEELERSRQREANARWVSPESSYKNQVLEKHGKLKVITCHFWVFVILPLIVTCLLPVMLT